MQNCVRHSEIVTYTDFGLDDDEISQLRQLDIKHLWKAVDKLGSFSQEIAGLKTSQLKASQTVSALLQQQKQLIGTMKADQQ